MNSKPILAVLIAICTLNLALTGWLAIDLHSSVKSGAIKEAAPLPAELSDSKRTAIFQQIQALYNAQDYDGLYAAFAREVQVQIPKSEFTASIKKLKDTFSNIEDGAYSHFELAGTQGGKNFYNLFYTVRLPKSAISPQGALKVSVAVDEGKVAIYGIFLNSITR